MILAGDIGGTKTILALFEYSQGTLTLHQLQEFQSQKATGIGEVIEDFWRQHARPALSAACFGVAGAVINGQCRTTNLPWHLSTAELQQHLQLENVTLLNDLATTAFGMLHLPAQDFIDINTTKAQPAANRAVIAAGTGLGEALLLHDGEKFHAVPTEGGHSDFAPLDAQQDALLQWLRRHYPDHVSYERIVSGAGIALLYDFLLDTGLAAASDQALNPSANVDRAALISQCALQQQHPTCVETLQLWLRIYAAEAGNLALKSLALGGVYIGGGIAPKILHAIDHKTFVDHFARKGRFETMLRDIPIRLSTNPQTALLGAAWIALGG